MRHILLFIISIFALLYLQSFAGPIKASYYWQPRSLVCEHYGGNNTRCTLHIPKKVVESNPGCFEELDKDNQTRIYCALDCAESDETTMVKKIPQNDHKCSQYYTYNLERRRQDWFIWRSGQCANKTIQLDVSCGTHKDPKVFYFENQHLFEYEDAEPGIQNQ